MKVGTASVWVLLIMCETSWSFNSPYVNRGRFKLAGLSAKRRRRSKATATSRVEQKQESPSLSSDILAPNSANIVSSESNVKPFQPEVSLGKGDSKLTPLAGTAEAKRKAYMEEKSGLERFVEEYTAPTPQGQEPKLIKTMKQLTWGAVILLVLIEIFVSVKVGGGPIDLNKISFGGGGGG